MPPTSTRLRDGAGEAARLDGFDFPIDATRPNYTKVQKQAFEALFTIATNLLMRWSCPQGTRRCTWPWRIAHGPSHCFSDDEPFRRVNRSVSPFNLFNYDSGLLNPHADRLLTVIKVRGGWFESGQSAPGFVMQRANGEMPMRPWETTR